MAGAKKPAKDDAKGDGAPKKSKKKLIIIIAVVLLLLGGGGGGGAWYFLVHKKADAHAAPKEEPPKPPIYVALDPFTVNLQPGEDGEKFLQVKINLQVSEQPQVDLIKAQMPQVRSRILTLLSSGKASELLTVEGKTALAQQIVESVNKPFAPKAPPQKVDAVYFSDFIIQ